MNSPIVAERSLKAITAAGKEIQLHLKIGFPFQVSQDEWMCPLEISGHKFVTPDLPGVDSWQALSLAHKLSQDLLKDFVRGGGKLIYLGAEVKHHEVSSIF